MAKRLSLTALFEPVEGGWTQARIVELPAVITAASTRDEARDMLLDALREYLLSLGRSNEAIEVKDPALSEPLEIVLGA
jgi:predicted RNase H-like HicB family nuclease